MEEKNRTPMEEMASRHFQKIENKAPPFAHAGKAVLLVVVQG